MVVRAPWDRYMEGYLRDRGILLAAVICPTTAAGAGLVHLHDASQAAFTREVLDGHPDVIDVVPAESASTLLYFHVREDP
jgi:hypothetical protein